MMRTLNGAKLKENIETRMRCNMDANIIGGASVWVWQDGVELYRNHFGAGVSERTVYRLASMTKPVTAVAALQQIEAGHLALTDTVDKFYPEFLDTPMVKAVNGALVEVGKPQKLPTIMHLLTHTSGIGGGEVEGLHHLKMPAQDRASLQRAIRCHAAYGMQFEPFADVQYSGRAAYDVLAGILEKVTDMPYDAYLKTSVFEPCGMADTTFAPSAEQWSRMIPMHDRVDGENEVGRTWDGCVFENVPVSHFLGGAGLASTLEDYSHFVRMLAQKGEFEGNRILKPESVERMGTAHLPYALHPRMRRWGLSVKVVTEEAYGRLPVGAFGWSGAYGTHFWVDPVNKIGAVYMKNSRYDGGGDAITSAEFEKDVTDALEG